ncbi:Reticulocyte-binding protein 2-like 5 [Homarus americanus]|uniref:Reticulocyte-binding protein 2-like 5 n=2 Tax=Homarus americanus TaxID=6706 RepID=A0A8J5N7L5_HOMAM|nr:Reticulocyte-binding protein 2-like 5 [Homarus americanus]
MVCVVLSYVVVLVVSQYRQRVLVTVVLLRLAMTCLLTLCFEDNTPTHNTLHHADDHDAHHHPHHLQSDLQQEVEEDLELHQPDLQQEEEVKQYSSSYLQRDLEEDQATLHLEPEVQQETEGQDHDEEKQMMEEMEGRAEEEERDEEVEEESRVLEENVREIVSCVEEEEEPEGERHHSLTQDEEEPQEERDESDVNQADVEDADDDGDGELLEDEVMAVDGDLTVHHQKKTVIAENEDCEYASEGDYETGGKGTTSESPPPEGSTCDREWEVERKRSVEHVEVVEGGRLAHEEEDQESINIDHYDDVFYTPVEEQSESGTNNGKEKVKEASKDTLNEDNVPKTDYCNNEWENRVMTSQSDSGDDKTEHVERGDNFIVITEEESDEVLQTEKKRNLDQKNKESRNGTCKEKLSVGLKTCNVMSNEEIAAAISWIRDLPPPLSGPKCTCKVPGTPPWKLARPCKLPEPLAAPSDSVPQPHDPVAAPPEPPPAAYATTLASVNHQIVTVQLRRPRSATVTKEAGSRTKDDCCDRQHVFCRSGRSLESKWESLCTTKTCVRGATPEETSKSVRVLAAEEPAMLRTNAENLREKRRIFRSWSFFGAKSPQDDLTRSLHGFTTTPSSSVGSSSSSVSSPICSSSTFATLITPRRWSRLLEQKRRSFQSCIFPDAYSPSIGGKLSARVKSESDVAPRKHSVSHEPIINIKPQSLSKTFNEKRKSVTSCIFPDTVNEDCTPYTRVKEEPDQKPVSRLKTGKSESLPKTKSNWRFRQFSSNGDIPGWRDSSVNNTCGVQLESSSSESQITSLESQLINSKLQTTESESKIRRNLSRTKRPKSLIIIPETQTVRVDPNINRPETAVKRPESLVVPSCVRVPKRDPRLTPPQPPEISCDLRSQSQGRLSAIDPREGPCYIHRSLSHILTQSHSESSQSIGRTPLIDLNSIVLRSPATKPKKRRKSARSWSYNEKMMVSSPEGVLYQTEGRSRRSGAWAPHVLRPRSLYPRDSSAEPSPTSNT